jgi:PhzF family phenazine biosynthesis protein
MSHTIYQVDAFAHAPFTGNPAGVMLVDGAISDERMQALAMEMNLSETAFVFTEEGAFRIRFFTPLREVPLCGHATLASAHILYEKGVVDRDADIHVRTLGGDLHVQHRGGRIVMDLPAYPLQRMPVPEAFAEVTGLTATELYATSHGWVMAVLASEQEVRQAAPDLGALVGVGLGSLIMTAPATGGDADFVVRCFVPALGIPEDPVTGSAHCALVPYWHGRLGKRQLISQQLSARGGRLHLEHRDDRVAVEGEAITVFEARLRV